MKKQKQFKPNHGSESNPKFNGQAHIEALYDSAWASYSKRFLFINRFCYACGSVSDAVDHLQPHKGNVLLFKQLDNHIPLCHRCHNTVTALFDKWYRPGNTIDPKLKWLAANRTRNRFEGRVKVLPSYE